MKRTIQLVVLLAAFAVWLGCETKSEKAAGESNAIAEAQAIEAKKAESLAAKRALILKASAVRAEERSRAAAERAKMTPTYKDSYGNVVYIKAELIRHITAETRRPGLQQAKAVDVSFSIPITFELVD